MAKKTHSTFEDAERRTRAILRGLRGDRSAHDIVVQLQLLGINISEQTYYRIENGDSGLITPVLRGFCQIYGVSASYIMGDTVDSDNNQVIDKLKKIIEDNKKIIEDVKKIFEDS